MGIKGDSHATQIYFLIYFLMSKHSRSTSEEALDQDDIHLNQDDMNDRDMEDNLRKKLISRLVELERANNLMLSQRTIESIKNDIGEVSIEDKDSNETMNTDPDQKAKEFLDLAFERLKPARPHVILTEKTCFGLQKKLHRYITFMNGTQKKSVYYSYMVGDTLRMLREKSSSFLVVGNTFAQWVCFLKFFTFD